MRFREWLRRIPGFFSRRLRTSSGPLPPDAEMRLYVDRIVSDGILLNEIPSPSDQEERRAEFIRQRLLEFGMDDIHGDELGNLFVIFPGSGFSGPYFLMYTDMDNPKYSTAESIVDVSGDRLQGIGIGDNSLGAAALLVLCEYLKKSRRPLEFNLVALFSLRNTPENGFAGINRFLEKWKDKIFGAAYFFGLNLGRLVSDSYGVCSLSFLLKSDNADARGRNYTDSTVDLAAQMYNEINRVDWGAYTAIVNLVRIASGVGFEYYPAEGVMDIEIFAKEPRSLEAARARIAAIAAEISRNKYFTIENSAVAVIPPAVDGLNEPLNAIVRKVHALLHIETASSQLPDYSSILNQLGIPAVTLGVTTGRKYLNDEYVEQKKIMSGFKQVLVFLDELNKERGTTRV